VSLAELGIDLTRGDAKPSEPEVSQGDGVPCGRGRGESPARAAPALSRVAGSGSTRLDTGTVPLPPYQVSQCIIVSSGLRGPGRKALPWV
jgi:hypothetical protein